MRLGLLVLEPRQNAVLEFFGGDADGAAVVGARDGSGEPASEILKPCTTGDTVETRGDQKAAPDECVRGYGLYYRNYPSAG